MKKIFFVFITVLSYLVFPHAVSAAATIYTVSPMGSDNNNGTTSPWKTIQKAANTMIEGDTVIVQAGNYASERVSVTKSGSSAAPITYQSDGVVVMKGFTINADYIIIDGFEIANTDYARYSGSTGAGIYLHGSYTILEHNTIHDASFRGIDLSSSDNSKTHDNIIKNNTLFHIEDVGINIAGNNNLVEENDISNIVQCHPKVVAAEGGCPPVSGYDADGIRFFGGGHIIRNNYIHDITFGSENYNPHIDCFQTWGPYDSFEAAHDVTIEQNRCFELYNHDNTAHGSGVTFSGSPYNITIKNNLFLAYQGVATNGTTTTSHHISVLNNTFINDVSFSGWPRGVGLDNSPYAIVKNNIFYNHGYYTVFALTDTSTTVVDYNLFYNSDGTKPRCVYWGNYSTCQSVNHNVWNINPLFVNPASYEYHLKSGSPACTGGEKGTYIGAYACGQGNTPAPIPGDLNGDGHVDLFDYNELVTYFGNPYTIYDYNVLVTNFGK